MKKLLLPIVAILLLGSCKKAAELIEEIQKDKIMAEDNHAAEDEADDISVMSDEAYNYGVNFDILNKKEILYTKEETSKHNILWISNTKSYPRTICKIIPISNDLLLNLYLTWIGNEQERYLIQSIYKALKTNNLLQKKKE